MSMKYNVKPKKQVQEVREKRTTYGKQFPNKSLTVQADKDRCCVNNILSKFRQTGLMDHVREHEGRYGDFTTADDFQEAMTIVAHAQQSFDLLPSEIRKEFDNDPREFLDFVHNPENEEKLVAMGLAKAKVVSQDENNMSSLAEQSGEAATGGASGDTAKQDA